MLIIIAFFFIYIFGGESSFKIPASALPKHSHGVDVSSSSAKLKGTLITEGGRHYHMIPIFSEDTGKGKTRFHFPCDTFGRLKENYNVSGLFTSDLTKACEMISKKDSKLNDLIDHNNPSTFNDYSIQLKSLSVEKESVYGHQHTIDLSKYNINITFNSIKIDDAGQGGKYYPAYYSVIKIMKYKNN